MKSCDPVAQVFEGGVVLPWGARTHRIREYGVPKKKSESWHDFWAEME